MSYLLYFRHIAQGDFHLEMSLTKGVSKLIEIEVFCSILKPFGFELFRSYMKLSRVV